MDAAFGFGNGVTGFFRSRAGLSQPGRGNYYGLQVECERATLLVRSPGDVFVYPAGVAQPEDAKAAWQKVWAEEWHFTPEHKPRPSNDWIHRGNQIVTRDFADAIDADRRPQANLDGAVRVTEMIQGVYASHFAGGARLALPLKERKHPLGSRRPSEKSIRAVLSRR